MKTAADYLIANFALLGADFDPAFLDDDFTDAKDALDCECVPFDAVEGELAEALFDYDAAEQRADETQYGCNCSLCHRTSTWAEDEDEFQLPGWLHIGRDYVCPECQPEHRRMTALIMRHNKQREYARMHRESNAYWAAQRRS